jgi:anti-sigma B factor antagonist
VPSLTTTQRQVGPVTIVDLRGNIGLGATRLMLRRTIHDLIESGRTKILLNLSQVDSVDSAGVGELVGAYVPVKTKGGELKILNPTKNVHRMMQITQLDRVFEVYTDEQMALQSFS